MAPESRAAWILVGKALPFFIGDALYMPPGPVQVEVKDINVAIDSFDWVLYFIGPALPKDEIT
ncbi:zinc-binding oxidoreductase [Penicillium pulvis]|uniref:zinc-binding oxidoreductase n=1 Tax=Penicillium pulvis TaxID=1562058 RepID=UPI002548ED01|nr:zinc-binding oxidoreductase [Penicillium pulvis]KAJ5784461.1 zinc-binding oxidoreductase [Penicillium pulvis]